MIKDISVQLIANSTLNREAALYWIRGQLGFLDYELPDGDPIAHVVMCAAKRCYNAFDLGQNKNLTKVRHDLAPHIANVVSSAHGSVLEHVTFTFAIEGITRVLTGELNRHRAGVAISEGSGRYIRFNDDIAYRLPTVFRPHKGDSVALEAKRGASADIMEDAFAVQADYYRQLEEIWADELAGTDFHTKKELTSAMRRIIGIGYCTGGVWTFNARALRHVICLRSAEGAEEEIRELAKLLYQAAEPVSPLLFADMHLNANGVIETKYPKI